MKLVLTFLSILLFLSMSVARPAHRNSSNENEVQLRMKKTDCVKIRNLKKSVYNYLESKLANLSPTQQEILAKKLIAKLNRHFSRRGHHRSDGPWTDNGEIFARMLKWKWTFLRYFFFSSIFLFQNCGIEWKEGGGEVQSNTDVNRRHCSVNSALLVKSGWKRF